LFAIAQKKVIGIFRVINAVYWKMADKFYSKRHRLWRHFPPLSSCRWNRHFLNQILFEWFLPKDELIGFNSCAPLN